MAKKSDYLKGWIPYRIKRYWAYVAATIVALVLPWIKIGGNHFFLLNFDQKQLHFLFTRFDMQELYIMPFLLMMLFLGIFALTAFAGRAWCGWACPQTIFRVIYRDLLETKLLKIRKNIKNKQKEPDYTKGSNGIKRVIAILIWTLLSVIAAADFMWYFVPPETFFKYLANPGEHTVMIGFVVGVAAFLVADIVFIKEDFCIYICPYSRVQSVLFDEDTIMAIYDPIRGGKIYEGHGEEKHKVATSQKELLEKDSEAECTMCESCVRVCPTHIDIRKGLQLECINCLECVDACTTVMGALNKPSLVQWSSERETEKHAGKTRYFRPKIIGYFSVLVLVVIMMFVMGSKKEGMLLNLNKDTRLYKVLDDGTVENSYLGLFQNTDNKKHTYTFTVDNKDIEIVTPKEPFSLGARSKRKKVIILKAKKPLIAPDAKEDVKIPITINAFATDDKKKINIFRKEIFVYPTKKHLEEVRGK
jgi:cytochrome c oxidase accessory protein FixG